MEPTETTPSRDVERLRVTIRGRVQGVGFRPFVYRVATENNLVGHVENDTSGVTVEVQGSRSSIDRFIKSLKTAAPAAAHVTEVATDAIEIRLAENAFQINVSRAGGAPRAGVTPDIATCDDCLRELRDPADRRHAYPYINCMHCGPRYSIIRGVPYDRSRTTMSAFTMCEKCRNEYDDPSNRRFHAQPNACPDCGPKLWLVNAARASLKGDPLRTAAEMLKDGKILAIRGLGGFQVACRADDTVAVKKIRQRKQRETKPFALMARSMDVVEEIVDCGPPGSDFHTSIASLLNGPESPILVIPRRQSEKVSEDVAPENTALGVMLPTTPLHHLLLDCGPDLLVMTSGNPSSEPLCADNQEALERLGHIADAFLLHDREIERRVDDSVLIALAPEHSPTDGSPWFMPLRRARGYVPVPLPLCHRADSSEAGEVLALGGDMKSAICVTREEEAILSEHLGELENPFAYRNFVRTIEKFLEFFDIHPRTVAVDLHPGYLSASHGRRWAREQGCHLVEVQHHHAHLAAILGEYGLEDEKIVAVVADGTGYGTDGAIWGGEILVGSASGFERAAHIGYYNLPGGDLAARETWRPAASVLQKIYGDDWVNAFDWKTRGVPADALKVLRARLASPDEAVPCSSTGRLFDAAAFLLGVCDRNVSEAQAAMALEALAMEGTSHCGGLDPGTLLKDRADGTFIHDPSPIFIALLDGLRKGESPGGLARFFHIALGQMLAEGAIRTARKNNISRVGLSGGCFANRLLMGGVAGRLRREGLDVLAHRSVPSGDGGLAFGQAVVARSAIKQGE